ncbi:MAG: outer membrane beta-barrel protein [Prevotellaceae bacterium]|jgi:hypothetical protein|nr:outer membrane beta-barrel protein [Prevotellaceae bacterium]
MKKLYSVFIFLLLISVFTVKAQNAPELIGKVVNDQNVPVENVSVIMQTADSVFIKAELTDDSGNFRFKQRPFSDLILIFQHISYNPLFMKIENNVNDAGSITMTEKQQTIDEATVKAMRPQLIINGSALSYSASSLIKNKPVSTAFDVLKEIPGITGSENSIELLGANRLRIIINGKTTTMPTEQIYVLLKTIPASQVKNIDVMYNAPAKYDFRGSLINVVLSTDSNKKIIGEISAGYKQSHYASEDFKGNILYAGKKFTLDFLANISTGKDWQKYNTFSRHTLKNNIFEIDQSLYKNSNYNRFNFRLGADYTFENESQLSFSYYTKAARLKSNIFADNHYEETATYDVSSINKSSSKNRLHNLHLQYDTKHNFTVGAEFTNYNAPDNNHFTSNINNIPADDFLNNSTQNIAQWKAFANKQQNISKSWTLEFGMSGGLNNSNTRIEYLYPQNGNYIENIEQHSDNEQKEYTGKFFVESSHKAGNKISTTFGFEIEYFHSAYYQKTLKTTLWKDWTFYPKIIFNYMISPPAHILQFNISTNKNYPSYWAVNPQTTYMDSYTETAGNPSLKPYSEYNGQLVYIYKQKYIFIAAASYMPDYFAQIPHQDENTLKTVYRYENYDFSLFTNISIIIPVKIKERFNTRISVHGLRIQDKKSDFYNSPFNRKHYVGAIAVSNTFLISKETPNFSLQINGRYQSLAIQGVYDLSDNFDLSSALKLTLKNQSYITVQYGNILRRQMPNLMIVDFGGQYSIRKNINKSYISFLFAWKIGNYKEKNYLQPNQSRFEKN